MKGLDYTTQTTATQAKAIKTAGYGFICRYLVPTTMAWKRLTKQESVILSNAGLQIVSVYESHASNAKKGGAQGTLDGKEAYAEAKIVGQPLFSTIYFAVDYDAQSGDIGLIEAYLKYAAKQIPGYEVGCYGSYSVCEEMSKRGIKHLWQTYAWSHGKKSPKANIYQSNNDTIAVEIRCDINESYGGEGFWNTLPVVKPKPKPIVKPAPVSRGSKSIPFSGRVLKYKFLKPLMTGTDVLAVQVRLGLKGKDGKYGILTYAAVRSYQKKNKLKVDGMVGAITWKKMFG